MGGRALATLATAALLAGCATAPPPDAPPPQAPQINVEVKREGGRAWYMSPTWMAIGAIALVLVVLLIVMASRGGGGATIVKG